MSTTVYPSSSSLLAKPIADTPEDREEFAERRRILLFEPDPALRRVLVSTLLRLGCVLTLKYDLDAALAILGDGDFDGVVVALEHDLSPVQRLAAAAPSGVRLVILVLAPPDPLLIRRVPALRFLAKPFDLRDLLGALNLPEKAQIVIRD